MQKQRIYVAIDLKSFFASVECVARGLNPLTTNLTVADVSRTEKTICLAVSPSLKAYGISGRPRLFEVLQRIKEVNRERLIKLPNHKFTGKSYNDLLLKSNPSLGVSYIVARPQMAKYMKSSTDIYKIYLKYLEPKDIHVYSIDEVFMDITEYIKYYKLSPREITKMLISDVLKSTGITATAGIGTNMYLAKIAMDILAKHTTPDENGVCIAELDEMGYRRKLWNHKPLTDFWRIGRGYSTRLQANGLYTMGDIARCSINDEDKLYKFFGVNAELLIDHAWGHESCAISEIKAYKPAANSLNSGQVLQYPYSYDKAKIVVYEMIDKMVVNMVHKRLISDTFVLTVGYDVSNLSISQISNEYYGEISVDYYGRKIPKPAHGTARVKSKTSSSELIIKAVVDLFERIVDKKLLVRRINVAACNLVGEDYVENEKQLKLFDDCDKAQDINSCKKQALEKEKNIQKTIIDLREKFGKNAVLKGVNLKPGATAIARNKQIGGHRA